MDLREEQTYRGSCFGRRQRWQWRCQYEQILRWGNVAFEKIEPGSEIIVEFWSRRSIRQQNTSLATGKLQVEVGDVLIQRWARPRTAIIRLAVR